MFVGNNFNLLLVTISSDRVRVLPSRPEIKLSAHGGYACSPNRFSGLETVGISSNTKVSGPRPIPPESCRPVPSPKNRVTAHPKLRNSPANKSEYDLRSSNNRREPLCPDPREIAVLGDVSLIIKKQNLFIFHRINMKVPQMDSWHSPD